MKVGEYVYVYVYTGSRQNIVGGGGSPCPGSLEQWTVDFSLSTVPIGVDCAPALSASIGSVVRPVTYIYPS